MKPIVCEECNDKIFKNVPNFRKHVRHFHPTKVAELFPKKAFNFSCETCGKNFSHKRHLLFHNRKVHNGEPCKQLTFICPLCEKRILWDEFTNHVEVMHDIRLVEENLCFQSLGEFTDWKDIIEAEDLNHYIKVRGDRQTGSGVLQRYFHCHRSGHYQSKGERLRRLKSQGSKKINAYCPANMKLMINPDGSCTVSYLKTHLGHRNDLRHLTLTRSDKTLLSSSSATTDLKLCAIFEDEKIPDSTSDEKAEKLPLVTQKDLSSIEAAFALSSVSLPISIDAWVAAMKDSALVLYFKPPHRVSRECFELEKEDYLIVMNESQCKVLKRFGQDCVCVDRTHNVTSKNFELVTLSVVDSTRQGFPCAFLVRQRSNRDALITFFNFIKEQAGILMPKVFMSDIDEFSFDSWVCVMGSPDKRLFCSWHVEHAWNMNLNTIIGRDKRTETYHLLRSLLLIERDANACNIAIYNAFNGMLADEDTREFASYFRDNFIRNVEYWAFCHRLYLGLNVNTHLERLHRIFECIYFDQRSVERIDKCLFVLMRFVKDQLFDRLVKHRHHLKIAGVLQNVKERHIASLKLELGDIREDNNTWQMSEASVKLGNEQCKCGLKCRECDTCLHRYTCSCIDNSINWNMCKHIHSISQFVEDKKLLLCNRIEEASSVGDDVSFEFGNNGDSEEIGTFIPELSTNIVDTNPFVEEKNILCRQFSELIKGISSFEELDVVRKSFCELKYKLKSVHSKFD